MKHLKSIMIATVLVFSSFSVVAQTAEELFEQTQQVAGQASSIQSSKVTGTTAEEISKAISIKFSKAQEIRQKALSLAKESLKLYEIAMKNGDVNAETGIFRVKLMLSSLYNDFNQCLESKALLNELVEQNKNIEMKSGALFSLGVNVYHGKCARKDKIKALELYGQACDLGDSLACVNYSYLKDELDKK